MIRLAEQSDYAQVVELAHEVHAENGILDYDDDLLFEVMAKHYERRGAIIGVIGPEGGRLEGFIMLTMGHLWYSRSWLLEELMIYVRPEYRHGEARIDALIEFEKSKSDAIGIPLVTGIFSATRLEAKVRLYRRRFGYPSGVIFTHNTPFNSGMNKFGDWVLRANIDAAPDLYGSGGDNGQISTDNHDD